VTSVSSTANRFDLAPRNQEPASALDQKQQARVSVPILVLAAAIVSLGTVMAFGVPLVRESRERSRAVEAFTYLDAVRAAQDRHYGRTGTYADALRKLDPRPPAPRYFEVQEAFSTHKGSLDHGWKLKLTRHRASGGYGRYTVVFTEEGFDSDSSTIADADHMSINPVLEAGSGAAAATRGLASRIADRTR
jgi:hypothetical protein